VGHSISLHTDSPEVDSAVDSTLNSTGLDSVLPLTPGLVIPVTVVLMSGPVTVTIAVISLVAMISWAGISSPQGLQD
jgi:hypothetical protein